VLAVLAVPVWAQLVLQYLMVLVLLYLMVLVLLYLMGPPQLRSSPQLVLRSSL
jgi:hypothetical protein